MVDGYVKVCTLCYNFVGFFSQVGLQWALGITSSIPSDSALKSVEVAVLSLRSAVQRLPSIFKQSSVNPLMPRPALNCFASVSCSVYLLEHAIWSHASDEPTRDIDLEAFRRWVLEGDLQQSLAETERIAQRYEARALMNRELVYGPSSSTSVHKL